MSKSTYTIHNNDSSSGDSIISLSNQCDKIGVITHCNIATVRLLGVDKAKIINKEIEKFMPSVYGSNHQEAISGFLYRNDYSVLPMHFGFVMHSSGFLIPVNIKITGLPSLYNDFNFVGALSVDTYPGAYSAHILMDTSYVIKGVTSSLVGMMNISKDIGTITNAKLHQLFPDVSHSLSILEIGVADEILFDSYVDNGNPNLHCLMKKVVINDQHTGYYLQLCQSLDGGTYTNARQKNKKFRITYCEDMNVYAREYDEECKHMT